MFIKNKRKYLPLSLSATPTTYLTTLKRRKEFGWFGCALERAL